MFSLFKRPKQPDPSGALRDTLFGDLPMNIWAGGDQPWDRFARAKESFEAGRPADAIDQWRGVLATPGLEARHYLQAWHFLRAAGIQPPADTAKQILGVVVEVALPGGLDLLAAYCDRSARYYNFSGAGVVWEHPDSSLDTPIDQLLTTAAAVVTSIGPHEGPRPAPPPRGQARLNFLTPSGLHFGQAPMTTLTQYPLAGRVLTAATQLMTAMIEKTPP